MRVFSGNLVRQFPSQITGNAGAGVQISVYVGRTGNTLASIFNAAGAPISNPLTTDSAGYYEFSAVDGEYRLSFGFPNIPDGYVDFLSGQELRMEFESLRNDFDTFVEVQGLVYKDPATFTTGATLNGPNEALRRASDGEYFRRVEGPYPYTVAPGTDPTVDPLYVAVGSASLAANLAAVDSNQLVGGIQAGELAALVKSSDQQGIDLSHQCGNGKTVVIAGDSLSFNAYDFPVPLNPTDYADGANSPGLMAWSHMLRDFIHRNDPNFVHASDFGFFPQGGATVLVNALTDTDKYFLPFNNTFAECKGFASTDVIRLTIPRVVDSDIIRLHCVNAGAGFAAKAGKVDVWVFTISGTFINKTTVNTGGRTGYLELEPFNIDIGDSFPKNKAVIVEIRNFRKTDDSEPGASGVSLLVQAAQTNCSNVYLTGRGGYTTAQIRAEKDTMITDYNPDVVMLIAGANDRALGRTSSTVIADLTDIVNSTRAVKPNCDFVFMTTTRASDAGFGPDEIVNGETMTEWLLAIRTAMLALGCRYFDTYNLFNRVPASVWRFDNIHMTKAGGKILFDNVVSEYFSASINENSLLLANPFPDYQMSSGVVIQDGPVPAPGFAVVQFSSAGNVYSVQQIDDRTGVLNTVLRGDDAFDLDVTFNYQLNQSKLSVNIVPVSSFGAVQPIVTIGSYTSNKVQATLFNLLGSPISAITDAQNNGQKYLIKWS